MDAIIQIAIRIMAIITLLLRIMPEIFSLADKLLFNSIKLYFLSRCC